ncbi:MAG: carbohydrate binding family 9 domain-containing protein, partial [Gammaproteobacteria bacterium]|nr:carbohydrate binding family 9 domain-containing protein [Gammaproteobacteria bacterium]
MLAVSAQGAAAAERGAVVFGSWLTPHFADTAKARVSAALGVDCRIVQVRLDGQVFHRLMSPALAEAAARALVSRAQSAGFGAWYLAGASAPVIAEECRCDDQTQTAAADPEPVPAAPDEMPAADPAPAALPDAETTAAAESDWRLKLNVRGDEEGAVNVAYINDADIRLDGNVDEIEWQGVASYDNMLVSEPDTLAETSYATVSRFFYTDRGLYVSAVMEQPPDTLITRLSARDQYINRDQFGVALDTSGDGLYGYWFMVNLGGSLQDGKVLPEYTMTEQWDGPWEAATALTDTGWSAEMFLPWSMMAMPPGEGEREMGFWLKRQVAHLDETWSWPALPRTGGRFISGLQPVTLPGVQPTRQIAAFPYMSGTVDQLAEDQRARVGVDFAYRPSPNLQLTATLNPDFGAVESDDVVVNLTAYETFFPEKRQFFLEGNEVFFTSPRADVNRYRGPQGSGARATPSTFTPEPTTLINTRRIGGAPRQLVNDVPDGIEVSGVERSRPTDLLGAAKLVGQAAGLRFGVLGAMEDDVVLRGTDESGAEVEWEGEGRDFGVVRALYEQTGSGRRSIGYMGTMVNLPGERDPAIVHGIDAHVRSPRGRLSWDGQYVYSYAPPNDRDSAAVTGHGIYNDFQFFQRRGLIHSGALDYIDRDLSMRALGFIGRNDAIVARYGIIRYANLKRFRQIRNSLFFSGQTNVDGFANRLGIFSSHSLMFNNSSEVKGYLNYFPSRWDDLNSRGNGMFKVKGRLFTQIGFGTDTALTG